MKTEEMLSLLIFGLICGGPIVLGIGTWMGYLIGKAEQAKNE